MFESDTSWIYNKLRTVLQSCILNLCFTFDLSQTNVKIICRRIHESLVLKSFQQFRWIPYNFCVSKIFLDSWTLVGIPWSKKSKTAILFILGRSFGWACMPRTDLNINCAFPRHFFRHIKWDWMAANKKIWQVCIL